MAAAVAFIPYAEPVRGVRDSKTLSGLQRAELVPQIVERALWLTVAAASVREIDRLNIRRATALAMRRAVGRAVADPAFRQRALQAGATSYRVFVDGLPMPECGFVHQAIVDGDALCYSIAAAGIVAKEVRDRLMRQLAARYPGYGWETNAGYATLQHCDALVARGPTPHHRRSFAPVAQLSFGL